MYKLLCTSYNKIGDTLQLRNNWIEERKNDKQLLNYLNNHNLPNVVLHVRILRVSALITTEDVEIEATNWEDCNPINAFKAGVKFADKN